MGLWSTYNVIRFWLLQLSSQYSFLHSILPWIPIKTFWGIIKLYWLIYIKGLLAHIHYYVRNVCSSLQIPCNLETTIMNIHVVSFPVQKQQKLIHCIVTHLNLSYSCGYFDLFFSEDWIFHRPLSLSGVGVWMREKCARSLRLSA